VPKVTPRNLFNINVLSDTPLAQLLENKENPAFFNLKHDFGRRWAGAQTDSAQVASDQRSGGILTFDLARDASRLLRQTAFARSSAAES